MELRALDWVLVGAVAVALPVARVVRSWASLDRLLADRITAVASVWLVAFLLVGAFGPVVVSEPTPNFDALGQPPVWGSVSVNTVTDCVGPVTGGRCHGSWQYPFGTTEFNGQPVGPLLVLGARTALTVAAGAAMLVVPVGTAIGATAAAVGGRVERLLLWIAEFLQTVPAVLVYILLFYWVVEGRLVLLTALLGLVGWGGVARVVRTEMVELQHESYVKAAEVGGVSQGRIVRTHLLPNVLPGVLTTAALQVPLFVLIEASVSFLTISGTGGQVTLGDPSVVSWGQLAFLGIVKTGPPGSWWIGWLPVGLLIVTAAAFNVVGDALVETLDPRGD